MIPAHVKSLLQDVYGARWGAAYLEWGLFENKGLSIKGKGRAAVASPPDNMAVFWTAGLLKPGTERADANVEVLKVFVLDDVGKSAKSRIDPDELELFMPPPTSRPESSPGNEQWQWGFTDGMDEDTVTALRRSLPWQSHATAMSNLIRVPMGVSGKPGVVHKVREVKRGPTYTAEEFIRLCGGLKVAVRSTKQVVADLRAPSEKAVEDILKLLPNDGTSPYCNSEPAWYNFCQALHGATGGERLDLWQEWCKPQGQRYDVEETWNRQRPLSSGWDTLVMYADKWSPKRGALAGLLFDDGVVEPEPPPFEDASAFRLQDPKKFPLRPWLYGRRLMRGYLSSTIASGGVGKSSLVMAEIISMVTGMNVIGEKPRLPLRVWLWNGEDDLTELGRRLHAICTKYGVNDADLGDRLYVDSGREKSIVIASSNGRGLEANGRVVEAIKAVIRKRKIDVLVLDPFVSAHRVSENDNMAIDLVAKTMSRIAEECGCAVDIVHHIRKPGSGATGQVSVDDARGASALINATRHSRVLDPMPPSVALKMGITNHRAYFAIRHDATKANMVPPGVGADWYKFESVGLGNGDDFPTDGGAPMDEDMVGVVTKFVPPARNITQDVGVITAVQDIVSKGKYKQNKQSPIWVGPVIAGALGVDILSPDGEALVRETLKSWLEKGWLKIENLYDDTRHKTPFVVVGEKPVEGDF